MLTSIVVVEPWFGWSRENSIISIDVGKIRSQFTLLGGIEDAQMKYPNLDPAILIGSLCIVHFLHIVAHLQPIVSDRTEMSNIASNSVTILVLCPLCKLRKTVDSFIDPFTCTLISHCRECRYKQVQRECLVVPWGVVPVNSKPAPFIELIEKERKMRGNKAVPQLKWSVVKRVGSIKTRVYRAKLVFHRTIHWQEKQIRFSYCDSHNSCCICSIPFFLYAISFCIA